MMRSSAATIQSVFDRFGTVDLARCGVFAGLALLMGVLTLHHAPARDEMQAWLIARESHSLGELMANLRHEGHPPLWHILLMGVQAITGSAAPAMLSAVQLLIGLSAIAILVWRAPFPLWLTALAGLNYFVVFEYGLIARSYGIGLLLTMIYLAWPRGIMPWLCIALLPHVSLHFALFGGALALLHFTGRDWNYARLGLAGASALLAAWLMQPDPATDSIWSNAALENRLVTSIVNMGSLLVPLSSYGGWNFLGLGEQLVPLNLAGAAAAVLILVPLLGHRRLALTLGAGLLAALFALSVFVYLCFARHYGVLALLVIAVAWQDWHAPQFKQRAFVAFSAWLAAMGTAAAIASLAVPFSQHDRAARWIASEGLARKTWAAYPPHISIEPAAWLGSTTYDLYKDCLGTFARWTYGNAPAVADPRFIDLVRRGVMRNGGELHVMLEAARLPVAIEGLRIAELAEFGAGAYAGRIRLYRVTASAPVLAVAPPLACPNPHRQQ